MPSLSSKLVEAAAAVDSAASQSAVYAAVEPLAHEQNAAECVGHFLADCMNESAKLSKKEAVIGLLLAAAYNG